MDTRSIDALGERVAKLEVLVGGPTNGEDNNHPVFVQLENLTEEESRVGEQPESSDARNEMAEMLEHLRASSEIVQEDVTLPKRALLPSPQQIAADHAAETPGRLKVPEPTKFEGARSSKDLGNFIWDLEEYFRAAKIPTHRQVSIASMFLTADEDTHPGR